MIDRTLSTLTFDVWHWLTKGIEIHFGPLVIVLVIIAAFWYATRRNGSVEYPQDRRSA